MITPSFSLTATERVLPKLALDFTTANLDNRVTFTRTTDATHPATYVNSNGYITQATDNQPRFDYNPVTLACNGLLIEESRTNIAIQSNAFDAVTGVWTTTAATITKNAATSPDNTTNASKLYESATTATHYLLGSSRSYTSGTAYTFSIFAKAGERSVIQFVPAAALFPVAFVNFNLATGALGTYSGVTSTSITNAGNGWYRCSVTLSATGTGSVAADNWLISNSASMARFGSYAGDGSSGIYIYGAQCEAGAFATSYIPTTTTSLTRNADVATMTGTNFSDWFNATEGSFFAQADALSIGTTNQDYVIQVGYSLGGLNDGINCGRNVGGVGGQAVTGMWQRTSGTNQALLYSANNVVTVGTPYKLVGTYKNNSYAASINGATVLTDSAGTVQTTLDILSIGKITGASTTMSGHVQKISYWPQRLTNAEVQAFAK